MMTDKDYWDREQFYDEVGRKLKRRNLKFDTNALFDLIIARWPTEKTACAVADELIATLPERFTPQPALTTFYVATLARYELVEANDEAQARELGRAALAKHYATVGQPTAEALINVTTVRPATSDEIELCRWHAEMVARDAMRDSFVNG